jgi:hypothetical protein
MKRILKFTALLSAAILINISCSEEFLETTPSDRVSGSALFSTTDNAYIALNGIYRFMWEYATETGGFGRHGSFGHMATLLTVDLMGEDMVVHSAGYGWFNTEYQYVSAESPLSTRTGVIWHNYYDNINNATRIVAAIDDAEGSILDRNNIKAQALAIRAMGYFMMAQLYQHTYVGNENMPCVPLYPEPTSVGGPRATVQQVYDMVTQDLDDAIELFQNAAPRIHKSHIDLTTARGLRARVALVMNDWATAAQQANLAKAGYTLYTPANYGPQGFNNIDATEWMWGAQINNEQATIYASFMSHMDARQMSYAQLGTQKKITRNLYEQIPDSDVRKSLWIAPGTGSGALVDYCQIKFGVKTLGAWDADYIYMRASEMYLIEAEALARQGGQDAAAAQVLYDLISKRDPNYTLSSNTGQALLDEILLHRRIELWGEGHRLFDLQRMKMDLDRVTNDVQPGNHNIALCRIQTKVTGDKHFIFKIPQDEVDANDNISDTDQNPL